MLPDLPGWDSLPTVTRYHSWAEIIGIVVLAVLVVAEVVAYKYGHRKDDLTEQQKIFADRRHDEEMTRVQHDTAQALERAAQLEKDAADSKLELARLSTPRVKLLTSDAVASLVDKLKPFAGTKFDVGHAPNGREQWDLLWQLEPVFAKAGWIFVDWNGEKFRTFGKLNWTMQVHMYGYANVSNVSIELSPENREKLLPAANALAEALNSIGITAVVEGGIISGTSATNHAIHFLVGPKE